ncbi:MAG: hypothetical protein G01um101420_613 [Parcubacteria group bacterium Gr01-1014_20]|nr:MAG: hypothetical protein G01um101420_613 [Parcubacteria group bacterium Gr01-1014_20]
MLLWGLKYLLETTSSSKFKNYTLQPPHNSPATTIWAELYGNSIARQDSDSVYFQTAS